VEEINISYKFSGFYRFVQGLEVLLVYGSRFCSIFKDRSAGSFEFLYYQQIEVFAGLIKELKIFRVLLQ
jgi:hypothetical protein